MSIGPSPPFSPPFGLPAAASVAPAPSLVNQAPSQRQRLRVLYYLIQENKATTVPQFERNSKIKTPTYQRHQYWHNFDQNHVFSPSLLYSMHFLTTLCRFCRYLKKVGDFGGLGQAKYDLEAFVKYDIHHSDKYSRKRHARWWPGPSPRTAAVQGSRCWEEANCNAVQEKYDFHKIGKYGMC